MGIISYYLTSAHKSYPQEITMSAPTESIQTPQETKSKQENNEGLKAAFATLLKADITKFEVANTPDGKGKILVVDSDYVDELQKKLDSVFQSHGHTLENIPYTLVAEKPAVSTSSSLQQPAATTAKVSIPKATFTMVNIQELDSKKLFARLFSKTLQREIGTVPEWREITGKKGAPLYRYDCVSDDDAALKEAQIKIYKRILSEATWEDLYKVFAKDNPTPIQANIKVSTGNQGPLRKHIDDLFAIRTDSNTGKKYILFDCLGIAKCILPVKFERVSPFLDEEAVLVNPDTTTATEASASVDPIVSAAIAPPKIEIQFNAEHFMAYMSTLLKQGILLAPESESLARPIAFHREQAIQSLTHIVIGVDQSGSLHGKTEVLQERLTETLDKFRDKLDGNATEIRLARFAGPQNKFENTQRKLSAKDALEEDKYALEKDIEGFKGTKNGTALYQFLHQEIILLKTKTFYNKFFILLSDGCDNDSADCYKPSTPNNLLTPLLRELDSTIPIQFQLLEIAGTEGINEGVFETIRAITNGQRTNIGKDLTGMQPFFDSLAKYNTGKFFIIFTQDATQFKMIMEEGEVVARNTDNAYVLLDVTKPFIINGQTFSAQPTTDIVQQTIVTLPESYEMKLTREQAAQAAAARITALEQSLEGSEAKAVAAAEEAKKANERAKLLEGGVATAQQRVQTLESTIADMKAQIEALQAQLDAFLIRQQQQPVDHRQSHSTNSTVSTVVGASSASTVPGPFMTPGYRASVESASNNGNTNATPPATTNGTSDRKKTCIIS